MSVLMCSIHIFNFIKSVGPLPGSQWVTRTIVRIWKQMFCLWIKTSDISVVTMCYAHSTFSCTRTSPSKFVKVLRSQFNWKSTLVGFESFLQVLHNKCYILHGNVAPEQAKRVDNKSYHRTSDNKPCVILYHGSPRMIWKPDTLIWQEDHRMTLS